MSARVPTETQARAKRDRALAAAHIARTQLGLDDDTWRALVRRVSAAAGAPVESSGALAPRELRMLLDELRRLGAQRPGAKKPASYPGKPHNFAAMPEMITKIEALLADMGLSWAYADAIAKRQCGLARVAWARKPEQLKAIIAALDVEQKKRDSNAFIDNAMRRLGIGDKQLAELTAGWPKNWRRRREFLQAICEHLMARIDMLDQKESAS